MTGQAKRERQKNKKEFKSRKHVLEILAQVWYLGLHFTTVDSFVLHVLWTPTKRATSDTCASRPIHAWLLARREASHHTGETKFTSIHVVVTSSIFISYPSRTYRTTEDEDVHQVKTGGKRNTTSAFPGPSPNPYP